MTDFVKVCAVCQAEILVESVICPACQATQSLPMDEQHFRQFYRDRSQSLPLQYLVTLTPPPSPAYHLPYLEVVEGGTQGRRFWLYKPSVFVGRWNPEAEIFPEIDLSDEDEAVNVSRQHAQICHTGEGYEIIDCDSRNGTYLNEEVRLVPGYGYPLRDGDRVRIGWLLLMFRTS